MKITSTILSIPPYLSTSWDQVASIQTETTGASLILVVILQDGTKKEIPGLDGKTIEQIFEAHTQFLESPPIEEEFPPISFSLQKEGDQLTSFVDTLQHNPEQGKLPNLPSHILEKMGEIAKIFGLQDFSDLPDPDETCNCIHCQLIRAMKGKGESLEESVTDAELQFRDWRIEQVDQKLYTVTSFLDPNEHYRVFLGEPLGCTCGNARCEHIQAVLRS